MGSIQTVLANNQQKAQQDRLGGWSFLYFECSSLGCFSYGNSPINIVQKPFFPLEKKITPIRVRGHPAG